MLPWKKKGRDRNHGMLVVLGITVLFITPFVLATLYFYQGGSGITKNKGYLLESPLNLADLALEAADSEFSQDALKQKWVLLFMQRGQCNEMCTEAVYKMQQVRTALGKYQSRVGRVFVTEPAIGVYEQARFVGTQYAQLSEQVMNNFFGSVKLPERQDLKEGGLFLVDPNENIVLFYPYNFNMDDVYTDMRHLLKSSQIG